MKKLNFTKKILLILVLAISAVFFNSYALISNLTTSAVSDYASGNYGSTSITIKNGKFTSHSTAGKGLPDKVDDWAVADNVIEEKTLKGIISVAEPYNSTQYPVPALSTNPKTPYENDDNYILAMASLGEPTRYGYKSSAITLEKDKFYAVSLHCKTTKGAKASIYTSLTNEYKKTFENISTSTEDADHWKDYYFLIATDSFTSTENFQIELRLGSRTTESTGAVFFDQVEITEIANSDFYSANEDLDNLIKINLDDKNYLPSFTNGDFEQTSDDDNKIIGFTVDSVNSDANPIVKVSSVSDINNLLISNFSLTEGKNYANNNTGANGNDNRELLIMNVDKAKTVIKTNEDNKIKIAQHGFYRLSMLAKTGNLSSGGLDVTLTNTTNIPTSTTPISKSRTGLTSSSDSGAYNGFTRVEFFIRGNAWKDCELSLSIALGGDETNISGWAIIDNIILQQISGSEYAKGSDSNQLDLSKDVPNTSDISNGLFDFVTSSTAGITYPALPQDWTASTNLTGSGIIRVNKELFDQDTSKFNYGLSSDQNPGPNTATNPSVPLGNNVFENVLMVKNTTNEDVYFKSTPSSNLTLSANSSGTSSIVKISVGVKTLGNSKAFIQVVSGNDVIANIDEITSTKWAIYDIYIKNGIATKTINLILGTHGDDKNNGNDKNTYAFFDHIIYKSNESGFDLSSYLKPQNQQDIAKYKNSIYVDLLENGFYSHSNQIVSGNIYKQNYMLTHQSEQETRAQYNGIINTAGNNSINVRDDANDNNVLVITNETASCQVLKTIDTYELAQDSYYEFSVWIKTSALSGDKDYGAHFELVNVNDDGEIIENNNNKNKFKNIIITDTDNNGWVKYSMYVLAETSQKVKVLLGLGYGENATQGSVYFDDLKIVQIEENEYVAQKANKTTLVSKVIEAPEEENNNDNNNSNTDNNNESGINIWALLSSIILVIALILAIVGYAIRRIPKRQIAKIKATEYEKSLYAVDENEIKRELNLNREQKVAELNKELEELEASKQEMNTTFDEEMKQNENSPEKNKLYVKHTKEVNKLDKKIDYLKSALTYITDPTNILNEEHRVINERKKQSKEEFLKLKQEELEKEQAELESQNNEEASTTKQKKHKYRNSSNKNKGDKK